MSRAKLNPVRKGRCPACQFGEFHHVSCQLGQSEAENARLQDGYDSLKCQYDEEHDKLLRLQERVEEIKRWLGTMCMFANQRKAERDALQARVEEAEAERDGIEQTMQDNADIAARFEALGRLLESYEVTLEMVSEAIERAEASKHDESKSITERYRQQGIADIARQVRIYLEDNEGVQPVAAARAAIKEEI